MGISTATTLTDERDVNSSSSFAPCDAGVETSGSGQSALSPIVDTWFQEVSDDAVEEDCKCACVRVTE